MTRVFQEEEGIIWRERPNLPYYRESVVVRMKRKGPVRSTETMHVLGWAEYAKKDEPPYFRRFWWVKPYDPYPGGPMEAVKPASIKAGRPSEPFGRDA